MASLLGMVVATLSSKLNGRRPITFRIDRALHNIDMLVALGCPPDGAPEWLHRQILAGFGWHKMRPPSN